MQNANGFCAGGFHVTRVGSHFSCQKFLAGFVKLQVAQITPMPCCSVAMRTPNNSLTNFTPMEDWVL